MSITIEREKLERMLMLLAVATFHTPALQAERTELVEAGLKALTAPVQEPVRECNSVDCQYIDGLGKTDCDWCRPKKPTAPPAAQRQWVGLTDEEIEPYYAANKPLIKWVEAKLKEKNT
jgi:hypothetical protein